MVVLLLGLALFLGCHSLRIVADGWREGVIAKTGPGPWKGLYSAASGVGLFLIVIGYGQARGEAGLWAAPATARFLTMLLVLAGFILIVAAYWPRNHIKAAVRDPMVVGVGCWALGHLLVKTSPAALALFGAFLVWAAADFVSMRRRGEAAPQGPASLVATAGTVVVGALAFVGFALWGHPVLIGVSPFG